MQLEEKEPTTDRRQTMKQTGAISGKHQQVSIYVCVYVLTLFIFSFYFFYSITFH
jgi:hypothetical protein